MWHGWYHLGLHQALSIHLKGHLWLRLCVDVAISVHTVQSYLKLVKVSGCQVSLLLLELLNSDCLHFACLGCSRSLVVVDLLKECLALCLASLMLLS